MFQATRQFLEEINKWTSQHGVSPLSRELAVKFLMARKFDVLRAIELFHSYRVRASVIISPFLCPPSAAVDSSPSVEGVYCNFSLQLSLQVPIKSEDTLNMKLEVLEGFLFVF